MALQGFNIPVQQPFDSTNVEEVMRFCVAELGSTLTITTLCSTSFERSYLSIKDKDSTTGETTEVAIPRKVMSAAVKMRGEVALPSLVVVNKDREDQGLSSIYMSQFIARCLISSARELMFCLDHTIEVKRSDEHFHFYGVRVPNSNITLDYFTEGDRKEVRHRGTLRNDA